MSHTGGSKGHVTPAPALGAGKARHRSDANYVKSYGRSSYESHKAKQPGQPSSPSTSPEPLKCVHSNAPFSPAAVLHQHSQPAAPTTAITTTTAAAAARAADPLATSPLSSPRSSCDDGDVDVSPLTTPSQSYVPEHRRRRGAGGESSASAVSGLPAPVARHVDPVWSAKAAANGSGEGADLVVHHRLPPGKENLLTGPVAAPTCGGAAEPPNAAGSGTRRGAVPRTVSPASRASPSTGASGASYRHTPSCGLHQRPQAAAAAPSTVGPTPPAAGSRAPVRRTPSAKGRPVTATLRKQPAHAPNAVSPIDIPAPASVAAAAETRALTPPRVQPDAQPDSPPPRPCGPAEVDPAVRHQLEQAQAVLDYVAEVAAALGERRRCAAPPRSTDTFRASVVPYRRRAHRNGHGRVASVSPDPHDPDAPEQTSSGSGSGDSVALLPDVHHAASRLLSAFTKLEYAQLGEDVDVPLLEREAAEHSARLLRLADAVERQLSLHEAAAVRQALAERRAVFQSMHQLVHFMASMTHEVVLLREAALRRDFDQAREVWCAFKVAVDLPAATAASPARCFTPAGMVARSPFFRWMADRWLPAMREWRALVREARESAARTGNVEAAVRRAQQASLRIDGLHEILRSGETITSLLRDDVEAPLEELARSLAQRRAVFAELQTVLDSGAVAEGTLRAAQLVPVVKAAQAASRARSGGCPSAQDEEGSQHLRRAEELLGRLHEADALLRTATATLQLPTPELATLLEHVTRGNELLASWGAAHDVAAAHNACAVGRSALESFKLLRPSGRLSDTGASCASSPRPEQTSTPASPGGDSVTPIRTSANSSVCAVGAGGGAGSPSANATAWIGDALPAGFNARSLYVAHRPGGAWSPELSMAYVELCDVFAMLFAQRQARRELEAALLTRASADEHGSGLSASAQATPRRPAWEGASTTPTPAAQSPAEAWRAGDDGYAYGHGRSVGSSPARTTRASDGTVQGPSAEELRRRIQQAEDAGVGGHLVEEARARLRRLDTLRLKIHFDAQTRVLPVPDAAQAVFADVYQQIHEFCQAQQQQQQALPSPSSPHHGSGAAERRLRVRYEDADGDFISLLDQQDWVMMLSELTPHGCGGVKVELFCDYPVMPGPMAAVDSFSMREADSSARPPQPPSTSPAAANARVAEGGSELESTDYRTEVTPDPARPAAPRASPPAPPAAGAEKRANVFDRLTSAAKSGGGASGTGTGHARKPLRIHPHALRQTSPQRAPLLPPRGRNAAAAAPGGARCVSPQKTAAAGQPAQRRQGNGAVARGKDSPPSAAAAGAGPQTAALTAENLRRNAASPHAEGAARPSAKPRRSGGRSPSGEEHGGATAGAAVTAEATRRPFPDTSVATLPERPAVPADVGDGAQGAGTATDATDSPLRASSTVHIDLEMARRWEMPSDEDELTLMEIRTRASMSTVRHERSVAGSEYAPSAVTRPTERLPRPAAVGSGKPPRNTFTTTLCSAKVDGMALPGAVSREAGTPAPTLKEVSSGSGSDDYAAAAAPSVDATAAPRARVAGSPTRAPRRWASDVFNLDEVETVCSDRSRVQRAAPEPKGPATLPPRPAIAANASPSKASPPGRRTPQRLRRGARGTPTRQRILDGGEASAEGDGDDDYDDGGVEVFAEMQRMREANSRAMAQRKPSWH